MSETMRCDQCRFWEPLPGFGDGNCNRYPPTLHSVAITVNGADCDVLASRFPPTDPDDWCGEFQPKDKSCDAMRTAVQDVFSPRVQNNLNGQWGDATVSTLEELTQLSSRELRGRRGFGNVMLKEVRDTLAVHGLKLRGE